MRSKVLKGVVDGIFLVINWHGDLSTVGQQRLIANDGTLYLTDLGPTMRMYLH